MCTCGKAAVLLQVSEDLLECGLGNSSPWIEWEATSQDRPHRYGALCAMVSPATITEVPPVDIEPLPLDADYLAHPEVLCVLIGISSDRSPQPWCEVEPLNIRQCPALHNTNPGLKAKERTIKQRISDWVSCKAIKNLNITRRLGSGEECSMRFKDVSPFIKFTGQEQGSMTVLSQLGNDFRRKGLGRDGVGCSCRRLRVRMHFRGMSGFLNWYHEDWRLAAGRVQTRYPACGTLYPE